MHGRAQRLASGGVEVDLDLEAHGRLQVRDRQAHGLAVGAELRDELTPYRQDALEGHPWADWATANLAASASGARKPGGWSRWNANKDLSWEPLRPELVCEVKYQSVLNGRFRATTRFVRWRPEPLVLFTIFAIGTVALSLYLLPRLKGAMIGFQWARFMHGFAKTD